MSAPGVVFDIKQLAVFDGPGIRTTVFLKGCPLRCSWCHNPEGLAVRPELMASANGCTGCGRCKAVCPHPGGCTACGACVARCPAGLRRIAGTVYTAEELAGTLLRDAAYLKSAGGGYTLSGGEPTMQPEFVVELLDRLAGSHRAIETCGHCAPELFETLLHRLELVMLDLKLMDSAAHKTHTGAGNGRILRNLRTLCAGGVPFVARVPVIPGVNDSPANFAATAAALKGAKALARVELMPYHQTAGAKYAMVGKEYRPTFDTAAAPNLAKEIFLAEGIPCTVL